MERSLRNRLKFGWLMFLGLVTVFFIDWGVEKWTRPYVTNGVRGVGLTLIMLAILPLAVRELATLFAAKRVTPFRLISVTGCALLILHAFATQFEKFQHISTSSLVFIICGVMLLAAFQRALEQKSEDAIVQMAGTVLAVLYLGGLAWFLIALRVKEGRDVAFTGTTWHVVMILCCVKGTDVGAYFTGRAFGRNKLIPWLSPGKTWEGLAGGIVFAGLVGAACAPFIENLGPIMAATFGMCIGAVGQLGDLLESMFKRDAAVKDSGSLVPGFGGVLDVIDSPLLAAPFAYILFSLFTR